MQGLIRCGYVCHFALYFCVKGQKRATSPWLPWFIVPGNYTLNTMEYLFGPSTHRPKNIPRISIEVRPCVSVWNDIIFLYGMIC